MPSIQFSCPNTRLRVQSWLVVDDPTAHPEQNQRYEPVTCSACMDIHLLDPKTGEVLLGERLARWCVWGPRADRATPAEELLHFSDEKLLRAMCASVNDIRYIVRRSRVVIEQSQIMLRGLEIQRLTHGELGSSTPASRSGTASAS